MSVYYGGADMFDALIYGRQHPANLDFLNNQMSADQFASMLSPVAAAMYNARSAVFQRIEESDIVRMAKAAMRKMENLWMPRGIYGITEIGQLQNANFDMQRVIMANPVVRRLYQNNGCEGYAGDYVDVEPGRIGWQHHDYRRVTQGVMLEDEAGDLWASNYYADPRPDEIELTLTEQADCLKTWEAVEAYIKMGADDPTSKWNASL